MAPYAAETKVPVAQSQAEIEKTLSRYGATSFAFATQPGSVTVMFEARDRRVRFDVPMPAQQAGENEASRRTREQIVRRLWRALLLCIKSKLESVESGIETFEEAFLSHVILPDGSTVGHHAVPRIKQAYSENKMLPMLPGPKGS